MTKTEALEYIKNSNATNFTIYGSCVKYCDLCHKPSEREFTIESKHLLSSLKHRYKSTGTSRVRKHICEECFIKLFPDSIEEN
jgi:hypothetical protein